MRCSLDAYHTRDSRIDVDERVRDAVEALRKLTVPVPPQIIVLKPVFELVKSAASLFMNLVSVLPDPSKAGKDIIDIASRVKDLKSAGDSSAFIEVHHRLGWTLRAWFNPGIRLDEMFGPIRDDEPFPN